MTDGNSASYGYQSIAGDPWQVRCVWSGDRNVDIRGTLGPSERGYAEDLAAAESYAGSYDGVRVETLADGHALVTEYPDEPGFFEAAVTTPDVELMSVKVDCGQAACPFDVQSAITAAQAAIRLGAGL